MSLLFLYLSCLGLSEAGNKIFHQIFNRSPLQYCQIHIPLAENTAWTIQALSLVFLPIKKNYFMTFATLTGLLNDMQTNPPLNFLGRLKSDQDKVLQRKSGAVSKSGERERAKESQKESERAKENQREPEGEPQ